MSEKDIFELKLYKKTEMGEVPIFVQITRDKIIFLASTEEEGELNPESLKTIKDIDDFSHRVHLHTPSEECEQPEKIVFFLKWVPK